MLAPSHGALAPSPTGNSGSAPDLSKKSCMFFVKSSNFTNTISQNNSSLYWIHFIK